MVLKMTFAEEKYAIESVLLPCFAGEEAKLIDYFRTTVHGVEALEIVYEESGNEAAFHIKMDNLEQAISTLECMKSNRTRRDALEKH